MSRLKRHGAWLLLAAFLVGGVVGPVAHTIQHQIDEAADSIASVAPASEGSVVFSEAQDTDSSHPADCLVCTARLVLDRAAHTPVPNPGQEVAMWATALDTVFSLRSVERLLIRGPPLGA